MALRELAVIDRAIHPCTLRIAIESDKIIRYESASSPTLGYVRRACRQTVAIGLDDTIRA